MVNLRGRHTLRSLAAEVGMSARNLARNFVQQTGITPHEFIENARIDAARRLLQGTDHPLQAVAYDCSFGSADRMRIVLASDWVYRRRSIAGASADWKRKRSSGGPVQRCGAMTQDNSLLTTNASAR